MIFLACPGQGSQTPGFLTPWLENQSFRARLEEYSEAIGIDLVKHGSESDAETIRQTKLAQPLIVAAGMAVWEAIGERVSTQCILENALIAGHSVGEITAAYLAGIFDAKTALTFVRQRSTYMHECTTTEETGMSAVVGGDRQEVLEHLKKHSLYPANINSATQVVAAGTPQKLAALAEDPPEKARVIPLKVAGAFHTDYMRQAREKLEQERNTFPAQNPHTPILSNKDGKALTQGPEYLDTLISQVSSPVRWDLCMETAAEQNPSCIIELCPAGTLTGLVKREISGITAIKVNHPDDLDAVAEFVATHFEKESE